MRRKLIQQGGTGLTFYVPKKWIDKKGLNPGDEVQIEEFEEGLLVNVDPKLDPISKINVEINTNEEMPAVRNAILNAFRAGYDIIDIHYEGDRKTLDAITQNDMIGFELIQKQDHNYSLERFTEPNYKDFDKIIEQQFHILNSIIDNFLHEDISEESDRVRRYVNFLKRCMQKRIFSPKTSSFMILFLDGLSEAARGFYHIRRNLNGVKISKEMEKSIRQLRDMVGHIRDAYFNKSTKSANRAFEIGYQLMYTDSKKLLLQEPVLAHFFLSCVREFYFIISPLTGIIYMESH